MNTQSDNNYTVYIIIAEETSTLFIIETLVFKLKRSFENPFLIGSEGRSCTTCLRTFLKMTPGKILLKILIFSAWLSLAFGECEVIDNKMIL
jgi:hypothetical protein